MQTVKIDIDRPGIMPTIHAMQGDALTRFIKFEFYASGQPYDLSGKTAQVGYQMRGGLEGAYDTITLPGGSNRPACVIDSNSVTVELAEVLTIDGNTGHITLAISTEEGGRLHSWAVPLYVGIASGAHLTDSGIADIDELLTASIQKVQDSTAAAEQAAKEAKESAERAAASEPAGAAERAEKAAQEAQTAQGEAESAKADAEASKTAAARSASSAQAQAEAAGAAKTAAESSAAAAAQSAQQAEAALDALDVEAIKTAITPPGTVQYFAMAAPPNGWLACNGAAVSRSAYAALFAAIGTTYGAGDNSTTFTLPDLRDRVAWGGTSVGTVKTAGLPNLTGTFAFNFNNYTLPEVSGLYKILTNQPFAKGISWSGDATTSADERLVFDASGSNAIYGRSDTVQPPALTLLPCIKY